MRKKSFLESFDIIMWQLVGLFPLLLCLFSYVNNVSFLSFLDIFFESMSIENNAIYNGLKIVFSAQYNLYLSDIILKCISFYATVQLLHIIVDLLLFVPSILSKLLNKCR